MRTKLLNPRMDFVFKKIFGSEKHPRILISFLNAVINPIDPITSVEFNNTEIEKDYIEDKFSRLDIKATTNTGEKINIEIQMKDEYNIIKRSLYYWSKLYEEQLTEGQKYNSLSKTICINILNFKYLNNDRFHNCYRLKEVETNEELTDMQEIHFIELPKFKLLDDDTDVDTIDMITAWIEFLKDPDSPVIRNLELKKVEIKEAKDELYRLSRDKSEIELYNLREKAFYDEISALAASEEKGIKKGIEQGEKNKSIEIAKNLLDILDNETISLKTGLSIVEIEKLR